MRLVRLVLAGIALTACSSPTAPGQIKGACIPIAGRFDARAPGYIIEYKNGVDPVAKTAELAAKFMFTPTHVYTALGGFSAQLNERAVVGVSCDASVAAIEHDAEAYLAAQ